jgi:hypothetical protein
MKNPKFEFLRRQGFDVLSVFVVSYQWVLAALCHCSWLQRLLSIAIRDSASA